MKQKDILHAFTQLGQFLKQELAKPDQAYDNQLQAVLEKAFQKNQWFTIENSRFALQSWAEELSESKLQDFVKNYPYAGHPKTIGIIMAGNIPMVGWHDLLCVLLSGNSAQIKLSAADQDFIPFLCQKLVEFEPQLADRIQFVPQITKYEAVIGTGSNTTERALRQYFSHVPLLLRGSRTSVAVIDENTSEKDLEKLADDVMRYFGLGCRNITQIFLPQGFDLDKLFTAFFPWKQIAAHNKYANNYDYNRAIGLMNHENLFDNGFLLLRESQALFSPVGVLNYHFYENKAEIDDFLQENSNKIQCTVGDRNNFIPFGETQKPHLSDFADGVDTMQFLADLF